MFVGRLDSSDEASASGTSRNGIQENNSVSTALQSPMWDISFTYSMHRAIHFCYSCEFNCRWSTVNITTDAKEKNRVL